MATNSTSNQPPRCYTRALKNARHLQKVAPHLFAKDPKAEGFGTGVPMEILRGLHLIRHDSPVLNRHKALAEFVRENPLPTPTARASRDALFNGTIHFAQVTFQTSSGNRVVATADMNQVVQYAQHAIGPLSRYASQYGTNSVTVSPTLLTHTAAVPTGTYTDAELQVWVNEMVLTNHLSTTASCIFVVSPPGVSVANVSGNSGYHGLASIPYIVAGIFTTGLTLADIADVYAMVVSHEIAEMIVDPNIVAGDPEVCDPCDINCSNLTRCYFDVSNNFLGSNQSTPPGGFAFSFYICAVVKTVDSAKCPAALANCAYAPPGRSIGPTPRVACAAALSGDLHVCALDQNNGLWHTIRRADGSWPFAFGDVQAQTRLIGPNPGIGPTPWVACADAPNGDLHVCAIDQNNGLWHTIRRADGSWPSAFGDVQAQTRLVGPNPGIGPTPRVACATAPNGDLHVCAIDQKNGLWHTIRRADGKWPFAFGDVQAQTRLIGPNPGIGPTPWVACAVAPNGDLHVCAISQSNGLWHTIRRADGKWPFAFGDVQAQTRLVGPNPGIGPTPRVACAAAPNGDLHVCAIDQKNGLWHTIRRADGKWPFAFGDVQAQTRLIGPNPGIGPTPWVACAVAPNGDLHVCAIDQKNGLWHTIRRADGKWPFAFGDVQAQTSVH